MNVDHATGKFVNKVEQEDNISAKTCIKVAQMTHSYKLQVVKTCIKVCPNDTLL